MYPTTCLSSHRRVVGTVEKERLQCPRASLIGSRKRAKELTSQSASKSLLRFVFAFVPGTGRAFRGSCSAVMSLPRSLIREVAICASSSMWQKVIVDVDAHIGIRRLVARAPNSTDRPLVSPQIECRTGGARVCAGMCVHMYAWFQSLVCFLTST